MFNKITVFIFVLMTLAMCALSDVLYKWDVDTNKEPPMKKTVSMFTGETITFSPRIVDSVMPSRIPTNALVFLLFKPDYTNVWFMGSSTGTVSRTNTGEVSVRYTPADDFGGTNILFQIGISNTGLNYRAFGNIIRRGSTPTVVVNGVRPITIDDMWRITNSNIMTKAYTDSATNNLYRQMYTVLTNEIDTYTGSATNNLYRQMYTVLTNEIDMATSQGFELPDGTVTNGQLNTTFVEKNNGSTTNLTAINGFQCRWQVSGLDIPFLTYNLDGVLARALLVGTHPIDSGGSYGSVYVQSEANYQSSVKMTGYGVSIVNQLHTSGDSFINGGNLGIGTSTPQAKLHVVGDVNIASNFIVMGESDIKVNGLKIDARKWYHSQTNWVEFTGENQVKEYTVICSDCNYWHWSNETVNIGLPYPLDYYSDSGFVVDEVYPPICNVAYYDGSDYSSAYFVPTTSTHITLEGTLGTLTLNYGSITNITTHYFATGNEVTNGVSSFQMKDTATGTFKTITVVNGVLTVQ